MFSCFFFFSLSDSGCVWFCSIRKFVNTLFLCILIWHIHYAFNYSFFFNYTCEEVTFLCLGFLAYYVSMFPFWSGLVRIQEEAQPVKFFDIKGSQKINTTLDTRERIEFSRVWNMPAGIMIPARNMPSMIGRNGNVGGFGLSSGLSLGQVSVLPSPFNVFDNLFFFLFFFFQSLEFCPIFVIIRFWFWCQLNDVLGLLKLTLSFKSDLIFFTSQNWSQLKPNQLKLSLLSFSLFVKRVIPSHCVKLLAHFPQENHQPSQNPRVFCTTLIPNNLNYPIN